MKLSAKARYAVRILLDLATHDGSGPVHSADIAERTGVSARFIEQILKPLKKAGLVQSRRGAAGGYELTAKPADVSLAQVIRTIEGRICLARCTEDPKSCQRAPECSSHKAWARVTRAMEAQLESISILDLMSEQ